MGSVVGAAGPFAFGVELAGVVGDEVAAFPVAVEGGAELGEHVGVAGGRQADVPLEAGRRGPSA